MSQSACPKCEYVHCARDVVAVGRFESTGVRGYRNGASDHLHQTRMDAIADLCNQRSDQ